ncbi:hypothetical protein ACPEEZ_14845 [Frigoribacterium sp. 2-23]|uniref:hypothetical protein n=1 Tax=Frigoribacterium sp. 2-23 TaxID=3415006 RepID=UPI003C701337
MTAHGPREAHGLDRDAYVELAAELETLVGALDGVAHVYQPRATLPALIAARDAADGTTPPPPPRVEIGDDGVVAVTIATEGDSESPQIAHRVHDVLFDQLVDAGVAVTRIDVRIARVD